MGLERSNFLKLLVVSTLIPQLFSRLLEDLSCNFERDFCSWEKPEWSTYAWSRREHKTPLLSSGSSSSSQVHGFYIYFNNTNDTSNAEAILQSIPVSKDIAKPCLRLNYNIYGSTKTTLEVGLLIYDKEYKVILWRSSGNKENSWKCGIVDLGSITQGDRIYIKAMSGSEIDSIVSVDDVQVLSNKECSVAECNKVNGKYEILELTEKIVSSTPEVTPSENDPEIVTLDPSLYSLQWSVGIPGAIVFFGIVLFIIIQLQGRQTRKLKRKQEKLAMRRMNSANWSTCSQDGSKITRNMSKTASFYSPVKQVDEMEEEKSTKQERNSKPITVKFSISEENETDETEKGSLKPKCDNGHIVQSEIEINATEKEILKQKRDNGHIVQCEIEMNETDKESLKPKRDNGHIVQCEITHHNYMSS